MTPTPYTALGEPVHALGDDLFAVTYPKPISRETAEMIKGRWRELVGDRIKLVILGDGAQIARLNTTVSAAATTPIYDALARERGWLS